MFIVFKKAFESTKFIWEQLWPGKYAINKMEINMKAYEK